MKTTFTLFGRIMKHITRSPDTIITVAITPIGIMLMFVYVFGGAIKASLPEGANYVNFQLPGILLMAIASGIAYTAFRMFGDKQRGIFARFNSMPISRSSALWAHVLTSLVSNMVTVVIIFLIALLMGFRSSAGILQWLSVTGILALFTLSLTWVAVIPGLTARSAEGASMFSYPLIFLSLFSSAFVPTETMPAAVRWFAENQPVTSIVEIVRALLNSDPVGNNIWVAIAWCIGILFVAWFFAMRAYRRRTV
ncbi:MAG: ABC transporter permease [Oscillospiraceae bacterium]|nr:ABC transporter permease [Oscillospiraceae bacterium]